MTPAVEDAKKVNRVTKKVAAQFSKVAKVEALTAQLRDTYGTSITRKELKEFEKRHKLVVQWVARRDAPSQTFRTPLGFVRFARGAYTIPTVAGTEPTFKEIVDGKRVLVNESGVPVTVTAPITVEAGEFPTSVVGPTLKEIVVDGDIVVTEV